MKPETSPFSATQNFDLSVGDLRTGLPARRISFARWRSPVASGGNRYDDTITAALGAPGIDVREYFLEGPWPTPGEQDRAALTELLRSEPPCLLDHLPASAAPPAAAAAPAHGPPPARHAHSFPADGPAPPPDRTPRPAPRRAKGAERKPRNDKPAAKAPRVVQEERHTPVSDLSALNVGQNLKVKAGNNAMDATVLEITKDGVRVQLTSGMSMIVRAEHLLF